MYAVLAAVALAATLPQLTSPAFAGAAAVRPAVAGIATPAAAADSVTLAAGVPCGAACDGKDPQSFTVIGPHGARYHCATDAKTLWTYHPSPYPNDPTVELRYSDRCQTAWTRGCCYSAYAVRSYYAPSGTFRTSATANGQTSNSSKWTAMVDDKDGLLAEACYDEAIGGPAHWKCSPRG